MPTITLVLAAFLSGAIWVQQSPNLWNTLGKVAIRTEQRDKKYTVDVPIFENEVKQLHGKEIVLKGYMIPLAELRKQNYFVLSRYPFSLCYFCGGAGVETVVEVNTKQPIAFTEDAVVIKGTLQLNEKRTDQLLYILNNAIQIK